MYKTRRLRMTELKALVMCYQLWQHMVDTDQPDKELAAVEVFGRGVELDSDCPCCEYHSRKYGVWSDQPCPFNCPLRSIWPNGCMKYDRNPYHLYRLSLNGDMEPLSGAPQIAQAAQRRVEEISYGRCTSEEI